MQAYRHNGTGDKVTALRFSYPVTSDTLDWCPSLVYSYRDAKTKLATGVLLQVAGGIENRQPVYEGNWLVKSGNWFTVLSNDTFINTYKRL